MAVGGLNGSANGGSDAAGDGELEEHPQSAGGQAESSDFVGEPDAEGPSAAATLMAIAAEDSPGADGFSLWALVIKSGEGAMADEHADGLAVGAGDLFETFDNRDPILLVAVEPSFVAHVCRLPPQVRH